MARPTEQYVSVRELALLVRTPSRTIERMVRFELIAPTVSEPALFFKPEVIPRVQKLVRLRIELGVGWSSMGVVLALMDKVKDLERQLDQGR